MPNKIESVEMTKDKHCQGSIRFVTADVKAVVTNVYVSRAMAGVYDAKKIRVTIEVIE